VAPPRFSALLQALRTMYELPVLDADELALTMAYVRENLTDDEARRITSTSYSWVDYLRVAQQAWSVDWVEGFLAQPDLRAAARWEAGLVTKSQGTLLMHHGVFEALRALVRSLAGNPGGAPLREILPEADDDTRAAVLKAGFRYLLLFPTLRDEGPEAVVGLSPGAAFRLGPPPAAPEPVEPAESFDAPYLLADMTAVLVELSTAPIPLRGDHPGLHQLGLRRAQHGSRDAGRRRHLHEGAPCRGGERLPFRQGGQDLPPVQLGQLHPAISSASAMWYS
ncbi:MAG TPA: hypothetical protein VK420_12655, partial [Longimicrobium sp.]|nr:hypothetical protein [Longimicrobium sp.]